VAKRGYATSSEYVRELIRADQDHERLASSRSMALHRRPQVPSTNAISAASEVGFGKPKTSDDEAHPAS
jgi:hypothetical protein